MKVKSTFFVELRLCLGIQLEGQLKEGGREIDREKEIKRAETYTFSPPMFRSYVQTAKGASQICVSDSELWHLGVV